MQGRKGDSGKLRFDLVAAWFEKAYVEVLTVGAKKYDDDNWKFVPNAKNRYYAALRRHIEDWWGGDKYDKEDNLHHLAHAAANLYFLMHFDREEELKDTKHTHKHIK